MNHAADVAGRFDHLAATYDDGAVHRWLAGEAARFAVEIEARRVLDIATGAGLVIEAMIAAGSAASFTGVDISAGMLAQAAGKPLAGRTDLRLVDGGRLPFADDSFDLTTCVSAMAYFPDPAAALAEWRRVTRHGRIVFTAWTDGGLTPQRLVRQAAAEAGIHLPDPSAALGSADRIRSVAARAGLTVVRLAVADHCEPLEHDDVRAWDRVTSGELAAPMRAAGRAARKRARHRFHQLLATAVGAGEPRRTRVQLVEMITARGGPDRG
jgi:SAM-dependent methyltransferase